MIRTDDPVADYGRYDAEQARRLEKLPKCEICGEPIQQEKAICYNNRWYCEACEFDVWNDIRSDFLESTECD